jgi:hypothetical protein
MEAGQHTAFQVDGQGHRAFTLSQDLEKSMDLARDLEFAPTLRTNGECCPGLRLLSWGQAAVNQLGKKGAQFITIHGCS